METTFKIEGEKHRLENSEGATICFTCGIDIESSLKNIMTPIDNGSKILCLMGFYTILDYRRKGYATLFLRQIIEHYKKTNYKFIALGVDKTNKQAIELYTKLGFVVKAERGSLDFMTLSL